ncbi:MAG: hypothetical protein HYW07_04880 [Candidatus Latescibacteria bacterium]|nr:hypothetical protein [Candidatus Latescibacterota bacterium]
MSLARCFLLFFSLCLAPQVHAQQFLPKSHPKCQTALKVFDDLVRVVSDGRTRPALQLLPRGTTSRMRVAWFNPEQNSLTLEERTYDLCASLGPDSLDALAAVLGHELAHYYKDHGWVGDFGNGFADLEVGQTLRQLRGDLTRMVELETEADYFGWFSGYIAGYQTLDMVPEVLRKIYAEYQLGDNIPGYPSLSERQEIGRHSAEKLHQLVPIFEAGQNLLIVKQYEEAARCFDHLARTFPSRELLNNAGLARALEAIPLFPEGQLRFAYPFELDAATRLRGGKKAEEYDLAEPREEHRSRLLEEAKDLFETARSKDPSYAPAYINLACIAELQDEAGEALFFAGKALQLARRNREALSLANALIARGIARAQSNPPDEEAARQDFEEARAGNPSLALFDLKALGLRPAGSLSADGEEKPSSQREQLGGLSAQEYDLILEAPDAIAGVPAASRSQPAIDIDAKQTASWSGLVIDTGYRTFVFLEARRGYQGESGRGIRIGSVMAQVAEAYGQPSALVPGRQGVYHVYERARIIFQASADGRVQGWMIYHIEE